MDLYPDDVAEDSERVHLMTDVETVRYTRDRVASASIDISFPQCLGKIRSASATAGRTVDPAFLYLYI
ncbi:hypothetical protein [Parasedimentitalea psychrophila]|uniref:Uncharacterized protein n=1 Tax=Parasedimentitalea psychrophila TaxID=2997337 RepID=A0A9Y2NZI5_9RHOB|nr:hypothetical protein [Parasedimentitalea psychrophila]WIY23641.1 hypothetical protein QPJ95_13385 [Parasedimentitalea psychrophila]